MEMSYRLFASLPLWARVFLDKPAYIFQPSRIIKRLCFRPIGRVSARLANGTPITVNTNEDIGRSIATLGVYDLVVSEAITRLLDPGDVAVDAGANIGYMSAIMSDRVGPRGRVMSFEPNPMIHQLLCENSKQWNVLAEIFNRALSANKGLATLYIPDNFETNQGIASLEVKNGNGFEVETVSLDDCINGTSIGLLKIDVEGHELSVLSGATRLLQQHEIRDIIFEDHTGYPSAVSQVLESHGYGIFRLNRSLLRPLLMAAGDRGYAPAGVLPNYLATVDPQRAKTRFEPFGWRCLSKGRT
jgi:FkbM family methyltransferase